MKKLTIFSLLIALPSIALARVEILDRVAVIVDDGLIMESQITQSILEIKMNMQAQNMPIPPADEMREQVIERLIIEELQLQLGDLYGIRISDGELNQTFNTIAANNQLSLEEFIVTIQEAGQSYESLREKIRNDMIIQRVQRGRVGNEINITEQEFESFMRTDPSVAQIRPELSVRQILVKTEKKAQSVIEKLENNEDFETIAREVSLAGNASSGGLMPWRKIADMPKVFGAALEEEIVGTVTSPISTGSGFHILKIEEKRGPFVKYEDQWNVRHILLMPTAIRDSSATLNEIEDIRNRVLAGEDFGELAKEFSEDEGSALNGGDLDWFPQGVMVSQFEEMMLKSENNVVSEVFQTDYGYHFLEVLGARNFDKTSELIEDRAYSGLYSRKFDEELENTLRSIRAEAFVEIKTLD
ncbi:peptidylprolyl isomerase [Gammaproteobacteria bacterium]|nr:peptidylprolyl isomerase [Gammaproteobacteria bacterium]